MVSEGTSNPGQLIIITNYWQRMAGKLSNIDYHGDFFGKFQWNVMTLEATWLAGSRHYR